MHHSYPSLRKYIFTQMMTNKEKCKGKRAMLPILAYNGLDDDDSIKITNTIQIKAV